MLINKIEKSLLLNTLTPEYGIIFYVEESVHSFSYDEKLQGKNTTELFLEQKPPYESFTLQFTDGLIMFNVDHFKNDDRFAIHTTQLFPAGHGGSNVGMGGSFSYIVDSKTLSFYGVGGYDPYRKEIVPLDQDFSNRGSAIYMLPFAVLMAFLSFLSCKNVLTSEVVPSEKLQKRRQMKNKMPLVSYHVLKLKNVNRQFGSYGEGGLWSNRVHLCRGHMREYTNENPLFGKLVGKFWIPPHARGSKKMGVVKKDYALCT